MAAPATRRKYFVNTLGFPANTAAEIVDNQGYDDMDAFRGAKKIHIEDLCRSICKTRAAADDDSDADDEEEDREQEMLPLVLNARHTQFLYQLVHYSTYLESVVREHTQANGSIANLNRITAYYDGVNGTSESDPTLSDHLSKYDNRNTVAMLEDVDNWIENNHGRKCIPLMAYIRIDGEDEEEGFLQPSPREELIRRAPLDNGDIYKHNTGLIWSMIYDVTHSTEAWPLVKGFRRNCNGRGAYQALIGHYRGHGQQNRIHTAAETLLRKSFYTGTRKFSFADFTSRLTGAFDDLESTGDPRTEIYKVNFMLQNINNEKLRAACSHIRGNPHLRANFTAAIDYLATEVAALEAENANNPSNRNISQLQTGSAGGRGSANRSSNNGGRGGRGRSRGRGQGGHGNNSNNNSGTWSEDGRYLLNK